MNFDESPIKIGILCGTIGFFMGIKILIIIILVIFLNHFLFKD
jgi:hypothetical protein